MFCDGSVARGPTCGQSWSGRPGASCWGRAFSGEVLLWLGAGLLQGGGLFASAPGLPCRGHLRDARPIEERQADRCGVSVKPFQGCASNPPHVHLPPTPPPVLPSHSQESLPSLWSGGSGLAVLIVSCVSFLKQFCVCFSLVHVVTRRELADCPPDRLPPQLFPGP